MAFTSLTFLFVFLPSVLLAYWACRCSQPRALFLLVASLFFYAWGEGKFVVVLLGSVAMSYVLGLWLESPHSGWRRTAAIVVAVTLNLTPLLVLKYGGFLVGNLNGVLSLCGRAPFSLPTWPLPAGVSFFTFMALTYLISVHRREVAAQRNPLTLGLAIAMFPTVMAGPILRYRDLVPQLAHRTLARGEVADGARRFVYGLAKKVLIANTLAGPSNAIFSLGPQDLSVGVAWFGLSCFTLQIFFDFSGYSDMAIGLGQMLGLKLPENFEYPYIAQSLRVFWLRWHMSLSSWFRDYVFLRVAYPIGRRLKGVRSTRLQDMWAYTASTLFTMLLIGLWHGASWTFVAWGLYHGVILSMERTRLGRRLASLPRPMQHLYTMIVVMVGWAIFRAGTADRVAGFLVSLVGFGGGIGRSAKLYAGGDVVLALAAGVVLSTRVWPVASAWFRARLGGAGRIGGICLAVGEVVGVIGLLVLSLCWLSAGTLTPFIYFRF